MICSLFERLSADTWKTLQKSIASRISQGEETITDTNLLALSSLKGIRVWKCPKHLEKHTGVDWEWLIGSNRLGWIRYAVQAKKLNLKRNHKYEHLNHHVKGMSQIRILELYARKVSAVPLYCFYNYTNLEKLSAYWQCTRPFTAEQMGCTVSDLATVKKALNKGSKKTFQNIHSSSESLPWRCLVTCPAIELSYQTGIHPLCERIRVFEQIPEDILNLFGDTDNIPRRERLSTLFAPKRVAIIDIDEAMQETDGRPGF
jgi:hypothetical protein